MPISGVRDFLFDPMNVDHTTKERALSLSVIIALSIITGGIFVVAFAAVRLCNRKVSKEDGDPRIKQISLTKLSPKQDDKDTKSATDKDAQPLDDEDLNPSTSKDPAIPDLAPPNTPSDGNPATPNTPDEDSTLTTPPPTTVATQDSNKTDSVDDDDSTQITKVDRIKQQHSKQLDKFEKWAAAKEWNKIHNAHYDWWMFPVKRRSAGYGDLYAVSDKDIAELKSDPQFMQNYRRGVRLVIEAWGWNLSQESAVAQPGKGQRWDGYGVRLAKMSDSLQLFGEKKLYKQLRLFFLDCLKQPTRISDLPWLCKTLRIPPSEVPTVHKAPRNPLPKPPTARPKQCVHTQPVNASTDPTAPPTPLPKPPRARAKQRVNTRAVTNPST